MNHGIVTDGRSGDVPVVRLRRATTCAERLARRERQREIDRIAREAAYIAEMDAMGPQHGWCYFASAGTDLIKIGFSMSPNQRMSTLRVGVPFPVDLLATVSGGTARERHYHSRFAEHRAFGEWFNRCPEIEAEIARIQGTPA